MVVVGAEEVIVEEQRRRHVLRREHVVAEEGDAAGGLGMQPRRNAEHELGADVGREQSLVDEDHGGRAADSASAPGGTPMPLMPSVFECGVVAGDAELDDVVAVGDAIGLRRPEPSDESGEGERGELLS